MKIEKVCPMENNITLLNIILAVMSLLLFVLLILKEKKINSKIDHLEKQNRGNIYSAVGNKSIPDRITKLELEISRLKKKNNEIIQWYEKDKFRTDKTNIGDNNFKQVLNYNFFKDRNSTIIDMYGQGKSKEEIARTLNKSIREIEMVINIIAK